MTARVDLDFSFAIHNRTGKYFIGKALLDATDLPTGDVFYWRWRAPRPPRGLTGKVVGRLQHMQVVGRTVGGPLRRLPERRPARPLLHLDPFSVPTTRLARRDAVLVHDLGPLTHPDLFGPQVGAIYRSIYARLAAVGPHLVFVSRTSRDAFFALHPGARPASERIIFPPVRTDRTRPAPARPAQVGESFLLTVGSIGRRKNQARTIEAYARSRLAADGVQLVLCGGPEPGFEAVAALAERTPGVVLLAYVPDTELAWLYAHARGFVLLSLLEGFGMPVIEAVRARLVPLVSRGDVLREVAGDGALDADPDDIDEIAAKLRQLATLNGADRAARLALLTASAQRFGDAAFHAGWRDALGDILADA